MRFAFVTGASKGIGFALVERLARVLPPSDWDVCLTARNEELGLEACRTLKNKGLNVKFHQLDITNSESRRQFLDFVKTNYPDGINVAVNNAAIYLKMDSFGEETRLTINTNFTCTLDFTLEFIPLLCENARVVHVSSTSAHMTLRKIGAELYERFTSPMDLDELRDCMAEFVKHAELGDHEECGWSSSYYHERYGWQPLSYGVSKMGLVKASYILGEKLRNDPRKIVMNSCCPGYVDTDMTSHKGTKSPEEGCDTPFYLATLPLGITSPINEFVSDRRIVPWDRDWEV